jgi:hypothetical protein
MMLVARRAIDRKALLLMRTAVAAALVLSVTPRFASAEVLDPLHGYAFDGTPVAPPKHPDGEKAAPNNDSKEPARVRPAYVSSRTIRRIASDNGFKLTGQPHRYKRSYVADADDDKGHHFRLIFNAYNGQLVARTDLTPNVPQVKAAENPALAAAPAPASKAAAVVAAPAPVTAVAAPAVSPPAPPAASFAAVSPCEMAPAQPQKSKSTAANDRSEPYAAPTWDEVSGQTTETTPAKSAEAEPAQPAGSGTTAANDRAEPYSAPTWDEVSGQTPSAAAAAPESDTTPGSPKITGSIPPALPNKNSPPEPYWAPTWSEVSGQDASSRTGGEP